MFLRCQSLLFVGDIRIEAVKAESQDAVRPLQKVISDLEGIPVIFKLCKVY